jgi:hypothetical protein
MELATRTHKFGTAVLNFETVGATWPLCPTATAFESQFDVIADSAPKLRYFYFSLPRALNIIIHSRDSSQCV